MNDCAHGRERKWRWNDATNESMEGTWMMMHGIGIQRECNGGAWQ